MAWPQALASQSRIIPLAAQSVRIDWSTAAGISGSAVIARVSGATSASANLLLPATTIHLTISARPDAGGTGVALASATTDIVIAADQTQSTNVSLQSTIDHLELNPVSPAVAVGGTAPVIVLAKDQSGSIVLLSASQVSWTSSDPAKATISQSGVTATLTGVTPGPTTLTALDRESQKQVSVIASVGGGSSGGLQVGSPWPKFHGDQGNSGFFTGPAATGSVSWTTSIGDTVWSCPAVDKDGTIYIEASVPPVLYALTPSGSVKWSNATLNASSSNAIMAPAIGSDGALLVNAQGGLYSLNSQTGSVNWKFSTGSQVVVGPPTISNAGLVMATCSDGRLIAISGATGALAWSIPLIRPTFTPPAIGAGGTVFVSSNSPNGQSNDSTFMALDGASGAQLWTVTLSHSSSGSPAIGSDGFIYVPMLDNNGVGALTSIDPSSHQIRWNNPNIQSNTTPAVSSAGVVVVGGNDQVIHCLNSSTGAEIWTFPMGSSPQASPVIMSSGVVYAAANSGRFVCLDSQTGALRFELNPGSGHTSPGIGTDGTVYIGGEAGLWAIH